MSDDAEEVRALRSYRSRLVYFEFPNAKSDEERDTVGADIRMAHDRIRQLEERMEPAVQSTHETGENGKKL